MIDISTAGILFLGEVEKHRLKKLVTCGWEVLPMTGHQFFMAHVTQGQPLGRAAPLDCVRKRGAGSEGSKGSQVFHLSRFKTSRRLDPSTQFSYSRLAIF